jgi:hypothetical protein
MVYNLDKLLKYIYNLPELKTLPCVIGITNLYIICDVNSSLVVLRHVTYLACS